MYWCCSSTRTETGHKSPRSFYARTRLPPAPHLQHGTAEVTAPRPALARGVTALSRQGFGDALLAGLLARGRGTGVPHAVCGRRHPAGGHARRRPELPHHGGARHSLPARVPAGAPHARRRRVLRVPVARRGRRAAHRAAHGVPPDRRRHASTARSRPLEAARQGSPPQCQPPGRGGAWQRRGCASGSNGSRRC